MIGIILREKKRALFAVREVQTLRTASAAFVAFAVLFSKEALLAFKALALACVTTQTHR